MKIACVQCDVQIGETERNVAAIERTLSATEADLVVYPECSLTGYAVASHDAAREIAIPRDHLALHHLQDAATRAGKLVVVGFAEEKGEALYNTATLLGLAAGPEFYRKTHLPELGYDRFVVPGDDLPVFGTPLGRIGILVCFDLRAPEAARELALQGADIILLPTNWPEGAEISAEVLAVARAVENKVWLASCNRVGEEGGFRFIGRSKIVAPNGEVIASAGKDAETIAADIDLALARDKRNRTIPGVYETTVFSSRRPELYKTSS